DRTGGRSRIAGHCGGGGRYHRARSRRGDPHRRSHRAVRDRRRPIVTETLFIFFVTGEPSGDTLGASLIAALRQRTGGRLRIAGIGGERMQDQGLDSLVPLGELAVAGVAEVLPRAPVILRRVRETVAAIRALRPDAVVTIDSS